MKFLKKIFVLYLLLAITTTVVPKIADKDVNNIPPIVLFGWEDNPTG